MTLFCRGGNYFFLFTLHPTSALNATGEFNLFPFVLAFNEVAEQLRPPDLLLGEGNKARNPLGPAHPREASKSVIGSGLFATRDLMKLD